MYIISIVVLSVLELRAVQWLNTLCRPTSYYCCCFIGNTLLWECSLFHLYKKQAQWAQWRTKIKNAQWFEWVLLFYIKKKHPELNGTCELQKARERSSSSFTCVASALSVRWLTNGLAVDALATSLPLLNLSETTWERPSSTPGTPRMVPRHKNSLPTGTTNLKLQFHLWPQLQNWGLLFPSACCCSGSNIFSHIDIMNQCLLLPPPKRVLLTCVSLIDCVTLFGPIPIPPLTHNLDALIPSLLFVSFQVKLKLHNCLCTKLCCISLNQTRICHSANIWKWTIPVLVFTLS